MLRYLFCNSMVFGNRTRGKNCLRLCRRKTTKQIKEEPPSKLAVDVVNYLESSPEYEHIKNKVPQHLMRKYTTPENMYLINKKTAKHIVETIKDRINIGSPIIEVNPGFGFLTEELLESQSNSIHMYETCNQFSSHLEKLQEKYPGRTTLKIEDFYGMWKLAFRDKFDQGSRVKDLLGALSTDEKDRDVKIIGSMSGLSFVRHLINNVIFHGTTNQLGKPDLFITMPGQHYEFLTDEAIQMNKHKSIPALFQMLFDFKILTTVPKVHFLPWTYQSDSKKITLMNEHQLYLVNMTQKNKLPCPSECLPLLWYFFKPQMFSKSTRVIPMLEQWIPGCGVWLITGQDPPGTNKELAPGTDDAQLPHMTIFTQFGDLNLKQKITVFKKLISWPEFEQCQFRVNMLNNLPKSITLREDEGKGTVVTHIEDIEPSDSDNEI